MGELNNFRELIKLSMKVSALSISTLAEQTGLNKKSIALYLNPTADDRGKNPEIGSGKLEKILDRLGINLNYRHKTIQLAQECASILAKKRIGADQIKTLSQDEMRVLTGKDELLLYYPEDELMQYRIESGLIENTSNFSYVRALIMYFSELPSEQPTPKEVCSALDKISESCENKVHTNNKQGANSGKTKTNHANVKKEMTSNVFGIVEDAGIIATSALIGSIGAIGLAVGTAAAIWATKKKK